MQASALFLRESIQLGPGHNGSQEFHVALGSIATQLRPEKRALSIEVFDTYVKITGPDHIACTPLSNVRSWRPIEEPTRRKPAA